MMAVLPDGFANHQRRFRWNIAEYAVPMFLAVDKTVLLLRVVRVGALDMPALPSNRRHDGFLGIVLCSPAVPIGGQAKVPVRDQINYVSHDSSLTLNSNVNCIVV